MTIINSVGNSLVGVSGTGKFVGDVTVKSSFNPIITSQLNPGDLTVAYDSGNYQGTIESLGGLTVVTINITTTTFTYSGGPFGTLIIEGAPAPLSSNNTYVGNGFISGFTLSAGSILTPQIQRNGSGTSSIIFIINDYASATPDSILDISQIPSASTLNVQLQFTYTTV